MAIAYVQSASVFSSNSNALSKAYTSNVAPGNLLIAYLVYTNLTAGAVTFGVSDTVNGTWTQAAVNSNASGGATAGAIFYKANVLGGATTVNSTFSVTANVGMVIEEFSGLDPSPLDVTFLDGSTSSVTNWISGPSASTAVANELVVYGIMANAAQTSTAGTGFTQDTNAISTSSTSGRLPVVYKIVSVTGTQTGAITLGGSGSSGVALLATFKQAAPVTSSPIYSVSPGVIGPV